MREAPRSLAPKPAAPAAKAAPKPAAKEAPAFEDTFEFGGEVKPLPPPPEPYVPKRVDPPLPPADALPPKPAVSELPHTFDHETFEFAPTPAAPAVAAPATAAHPPGVAATVKKPGWFGRQRERVKDAYYRAVGNDSFTVGKNGEIIRGHRDGSVSVLTADGKVQMAARGWDAENVLKRETLKNIKVHDAKHLNTPDNHAVNGLLGKNSAGEVVHQPSPEGSFAVNVNRETKLPKTAIGRAYNKVVNKPVDLAVEGPMFEKGADGSVFAVGKDGAHVVHEGTNVEAANYKMAKKYQNEKTYELDQNIMDSAQQPRDWATRVEIQRAAPATKTPTP